MVAESDEAHRTAITFHRKRRATSFLKSDLENIPGIGPVKRKKLLRHFGSVKKIRKASKKDLQQVLGLSGKNIDAIIVGLR